MDRRQFVSTSTCLSLASTTSFAHSKQETFSVGVIGHTGRGDYGHGLDTVWNHIAETSIVAVADPNHQGRTKELSRLKLNDSAGYTDYREMLRRVRPDIVAVCPRHADQHQDMIVAAIESGVKGIYVEKPFVRTPSEADDILKRSRQDSTKIAVAHRNRYHPTLMAVKHLIAEGAIGKPIEIRGRGKGDRRGGAEDLWVLGSHVLNMMSALAGPPKTCSAVMLQDGRRVTKADVRKGAEGLGLLAGNELHARYLFGDGLVGYFDSKANDGTKNAGFGLQVIGSEGIIHFQADKLPLAHLAPGNPFQPTEKSRPWIPITSAGAGNAELIEDLVDLIHHHKLPARDLIDSIREDREPICSATEGALTVEMICAVFESHRKGSAAVEFPLSERGNALAEL